MDLSINRGTFPASFSFKGTKLEVDSGQWTKTKQNGTIQKPREERKCGNLILIVFSPVFMT